MRRYYDLLFPQELEEDEYICLFFKWPDGKGGEYTSTEYAKNFEEYCRRIDNYRNKADVFNGLATVVPDKNGNLGRKEDNIYRQSVMFIDTDRKDYPSLDDAFDFTKLINDKIPDLFIHACYDTGHGYHFYLSVETTDNVKPLQVVNKELVRFIGGDPKACCITQLARVPGTFNRKESDLFGGYPLVKEVYNARKNPDKFFPYSEAQIRKKIAQAKKKEQSLTLETIL